ncbi:Spc7 kinetochore protein-domain-containing protein [Myxozyma melibiosi]|uniref:Spc7 kinetochore protein-domain-containing protein n=1 Tax=Myxozyma melibiosi TaxID=54550 RepID=A0ABR1FDY9_9ASCO
MSSPSKVISPRKSPRNHRKSLAFLPSADKENGLSAGSMGRRKRAKSLDGTEDPTLSIPKKRRNESRIPTASGPPRGILKATYSNDDNHTVIGVMQVSLKEEPVSKPKPSRVMSRRVSFAPEATLHTFDIDSLDDASSQANSSAASTPRRSDDRSAAEQRPPLANLDQYNQLSPVSLRGVQDSVEQTADDSDDDAQFSDDDSEVEMEDATDVFDDETFNQIASSTSPFRAVQSPVGTVRAGKGSIFGSGLFSPKPARSQVNDNDDDQSEDDFNDDGETQTMEVTTAFGSISGNSNLTSAQDADEDEDQTMEVTRAVGWIEQPQMEEENDDDDNVTMDITRAGGFIVSKADTSVVQDDVTMDVTMDATRAIGSIQESHETEDSNADITMDVTRAVGFIEQDDNSVTMDVTCAVGVIEQPAVSDDEDDMDVTMEVTRAIGFIQPEVDSDEDVSRTEAMDVTRAIGSIQPKEADDTVAMDVTMAIGSIADNSSMPEEANGTSEDSHVATPKAIQSPQINRTPTRAGSATPRSSAKRSLVRTDSMGLSTPVKAPEGVQNSPGPSAISRKRKSLLESQILGQEFTGQNITIGTPEGRKLKNDINETLFNASSSNLQKRIQSLTPKKVVRSPVKSLVKSARKEVIAAIRSEEQEALAKRYSPLKNHASTPARSQTRLLSDLPAPVLRFDLAPKQPNTPSAKVPLVVERAEEMNEDDYVPLSLNEFLQMTSVQFLEGLNTKRRNTTMMQSCDLLSEKSFEDVVLSRQLHCPMLELYEFSCRELRKNIQEGNDLFERLESETLEENPNLFRQYLSASIDGQVAFCAQFKVIKTYARLLSKGVWYEWRSKLLDGVMNSLTKNQSALQKDIQDLQPKEKSVSLSLPEIRAKHSALKTKLERLRQRRNEVEGCDKDELLSAREMLTAEKAEVQSKQQVREELAASDQNLTRMVDEKRSGIESCNAGIAKAEAIVEENRGIDTDQTALIKDKLTLLGELYGWQVTSYADSLITLSLGDFVTVEISIAEERIVKTSFATSESPVISFFVSAIELLAKSLPSSKFLRSGSSLLLQYKAICREINWLENRYVSNIHLDNMALKIESEVFIRETLTKFRAKYQLSLDLTVPDFPAIHSIPTFELVYGSFDSLPRYACKSTDSTSTMSRGREMENGAECTNIIGAFAGF